MVQLKYQGQFTSVKRVSKVAMLLNILFFIFIKRPKSSSMTCVSATVYVSNVLTLTLHIHDYPKRNHSLG